MQKENNVKILDDDGGSQLASEENIKKLLTKAKSFSYFNRNRLVAVDN